MFLEACVIVRNFVAWIDDERAKFTDTDVSTNERKSKSSERDDVISL